MPKGNGEEIPADELKTEIDTDPAAIGLTFAQENSFNEVELNEIREGAEYTINLQIFRAQDLWGAFDNQEYFDLGADEIEKRSMQSILVGSFNSEELERTAALVDKIRDTFGTSSQTWTNLQTLAQRQGSRAEIVWGENSTVTTAEIQLARELP